MEIKKTKLFKRLLNDASEIERDFKNFKKEYASLSEDSNLSIDRILKCHLLLEHYLDKYLEAANPAIQNWEDVRLSFYQKLELADHPKTIIHLIFPGMKCVNKIRNRTVHNLNASLKKNELGPIREFLDIWYGALGKPVRNGIEMIEDFTLTSCAFMNSYVTSIDRHADNAGLSGLLKFYDGSLKEVNESDNEN